MHRFHVRRRAIAVSDLDTKDKCENNEATRLVEGSNGDTDAEIFGVSLILELLRERLISPATYHRKHGEYPLVLTASGAVKVPRVR